MAGYSAKSKIKRGLKLCTRYYSAKCKSPSISFSMI
jgi:hypothetical protein